MTVEAINGFYVGYFSSTAGEGIALFVFKDGILIGADGGAFQYDGNIATTSDGYEIDATVSIPAGATSIVGITAGPEGLSYPVKFKLPFSFLEQPFIRILTPYSPVNMRLQKLRDLD